MAFVEQFADVEAVDSVLPGSERVPGSGSESESRIMSPPYAETRTRRFLSWANVMFRQKRLSCSSIGCRCFLSIYVDVFSITSKTELRGGGESSECRDMLNAST